MLKRALNLVVQGENLTQTLARETMEVIMRGEASGAQVGGLLVALRMKGENHREITGFAQAMRAQAKPLGLDGEFADTCGTGGDCAGTFNISTTAAFVVAGCGLPVAKHGNRAFSSKSGSADLLSALDVKIDLLPHQVAACINKTGIGFLYAPTFHGAMLHAAGPRRDLGMRTVFNLLGPLTNPAAPAFQAVGVWERDLVSVVAQVAQELGARGAMVFHGGGGLDELSLSGENLVAELGAGQLKTYFLEARDVGLLPAPLSALAGGTPQENAAITTRILEGERGPKRDVVLFNAAALLKAAGVAKDWKEGIAMAGEAIDNGNAMARLGALRKLSQEVGANAISNCKS